VIGTIEVLADAARYVAVMLIVIVLLGPGQPVRLECGSELHRPCRRRRDQAVVSGRGRRAQGQDPASLAGLD
jgi:hypothetical protein